MMEMFRLNFKRYTLPILLILLLTVSNTYASDAINITVKLANEGNIGAQSLLGNLYYTGKGGMEINYQEALRWFKLSAEQGSANSLFSLGQIYSSGNGVSIDYQKAAMYYMMSAKQGHILSQTALGEIYYSGRGVPKDYILSYMWLNLASANNFPLAQELLENVTRKMTPNQIEKAQELSRNWKPRVWEELKIEY